MVVRCGGWLWEQLSLPMAGEPDLSCIHVRKYALGRPQDHTEQGKEKHFAGLQCYITMPAGKPKGAAIVAPDIWGISLPYARLWVDRLAEAGYVTDHAACNVHSFRPV